MNAFTFSNNLFFLNKKGVYVFACVLQFISITRTGTILRLDKTVGGRFKVQNACRSFTFEACHTGILWTSLMVALCCPSHFAAEKSVVMLIYSSGSDCFYLKGDFFFFFGPAWGGGGGVG